MAVQLTSGGFSDWTGAITATGDTGGNDSGAGTVYLADASSPDGSGVASVANKKIAFNTAHYTPLPASPDSLEDLSHSVWRDRKSVV